MNFLLKILQFIGSLTGLFTIGPFEDTPDPDPLPEDGDTGDGDTGDGDTGDGDTGDGDMDDGGMGDGGMGDGDMGDGDMGDGDMGDMDGDHGDHGDHIEMIPPPSPDATAEEIAAYVDAVRAQTDTHSHGDDAAKASEHLAALGLVPHADATHIAIGSGDWDDPANWHNGEIPGDDAKVLIPQGIDITYDSISEARLFTLRVDGDLQFATDADSQMIVDTMVISPTGTLTIGTAETPVQPDVTVDIIFANNGPIDTDWDPMLLSRGLIAHGTTEIHGAEKDSHDKVDTDPMTGDTHVSMAGVPTGWQVGDTIVIAGTHYDGYHYEWDGETQTGDVVHHPPEDEVRVITAIDEDGTIWFDEPLVFDHDAPRPDLNTSVANYTRNVSFETENAETAEIYERAHVMFMHNDDVDVSYAEFLELGRTDKSFDSANVSDFDTVDFDTNVQGRYALHLHRAGTESLEDPAILTGNAVYGSPGWGYVHHDSNAILDNNASYDTYGAGFVAETGNETGAWTDNIAIYAMGQNWAAPKNASDIADGAFDTARGGDGFWFQGRMVTATDNIAASVNTGFVYFHRDGSSEAMIDFDAQLFDHPDALYYNPESHAQWTPILGFSNNETFAAKEGLHVVKSGPNQGHDIWSTFEDFTAWSVVSGAHFEYTSHYLISGFDLVGRDDGVYHAAHTGISFGNNTADMSIVDATISGFDTGIDLKKNFTGDHGTTPELHNYILVDPDIADNGTPLANYDPTLDHLISRDDLGEYAPDIQLDAPLYFAAVPGGADVAFEISGTKVDSLGATDFPGGTESAGVLLSDAIRLMENEGYWTTSDGVNYMLVDIYFTDRLTGELYSETHSMAIDPGVVLWKSPFNGIQDLTEIDGVTFAGDIALDIATPVGGETTSAAMTTSASIVAPDAEDDLWAALTSDQGVVHNTCTADPDCDEDEMMDITLI